MMITALKNLLDTQLVAQVQRARYTRWDAAIHFYSLSLCPFLKTFLLCSISSFSHFITPLPNMLKTDDWWFIGDSWWLTADDSRLIVDVWSFMTSPQLKNLSKYKYQHNTENIRTCWENIWKYIIHTKYMETSMRRYEIWTNAMKS